MLFTSSQSTFCKWKVHKSIFCSVRSTSSKSDFSSVSKRCDFPQILRVFRAYGLLTTGFVVLWSMDLCSEICDRNSEICELRYVICGLWSAICDRWSEICYLWSVIHCDMNSEIWDVWSEICDLRFVIWDLWFSVIGILRSVICNLWFSEIGILRSEIWDARSEISDLRSRFWRRCADPCTELGINDFFDLVKSKSKRELEFRFLVHSMKFAYLPFINNALLHGGLFSLKKGHLKFRQLHILWVLDYIQKSTVPS